MIYPFPLNQVVLESLTKDSKDLINWNRSLNLDSRALEIWNKWVSRHINRKFLFRNISKIDILWYHCSDEECVKSFETKMEEYIGEKDWKQSRTDDGYALVLGFVFYDVVGDEIHLHIIESFVQQKGFGTMMLSKLFRQHNKLIRPIDIQDSSMSWFEKEQCQQYLVSDWKKDNK